MAMLAYISHEKEQVAANTVPSPYDSLTKNLAAVGGYGSSAPPKRPNEIGSVRFLARDGYGLIGLSAAGVQRSLPSHSIKLTPNDFFSTSIPAPVRWSPFAIVERPQRQEAGTIKSDPFVAKLSGPVVVLKSLKEKWSVDDSTMAKLLGYEKTSDFVALAAGKAILERTPDRADRFTTLVLIQSLLEGLFPTQRAIVQWLNTINTRLGETPLGHMRKGRLRNLYDLVDLIRGATHP